jgi:hypothetical protein
MKMDNHLTGKKTILAFSSYSLNSGMDGNMLR